MPRVPLIDRLLLWPFGVARNLFFLQGLAFGCASAAAFAWTRSDVSPWIHRSVVVAGLMSGDLRGRGRAVVLDAIVDADARSLVRSRRIRVADERLTVSLVLIAGLTLIVCGAARVVASDPRAALGYRILEGADDAVAVRRHRQLPILLALFVPSLVTVAAVFSFCFRSSCSPDCGSGR